MERDHLFDSGIPFCHSASVADSVRLCLEEYDWDLGDAFADLCDGIFQLTVLRPNGISGVKKARQYDQFPRRSPLSSALRLRGRRRVIMLCSPRIRREFFSARREEPAEKDAPSAEMSAENNRLDPESFPFGVQSDN